VNENLFFDVGLLKSCGKNVIIGKTVRIRNPEKVSIGDNVIIDDFTYISGDVTIGDYVHIGPSCVLSASSMQIVMEAFSGLSAGCKVYAGSSNYINCGLDLPTIPIEHQYNVILESVLLQSFTLVGANGIILPGCTLPQGLSVAANVIVRKKLSLRSWHVLLDNEGKMIKRRGVKELDERVNKFYAIKVNDE
jgi:acetyltransferase-like isoleucine patch superfamily enzyme